MKEKYIFELFEGIISFPFINNRLNILRQNALLSTMEKKILVKIAFDLQEVKLKIGDSLENTEAKEGDALTSCAMKKMKTEGAASLEQETNENLSNINQD